MKYGLVDPEEWQTNDAWPSEGSFCIAFLENTGELARNQLVRNPPSGDGSVYVIENGVARRVGYFTLPLDIHIFGMFDTELDAVAYYMDEYINATIATEHGINRNLQENLLIDEYIEDSTQQRRATRYWAVIFACIFAIILVLLLYFIRVRLGYPPLLGGL